MNNANYLVSKFFAAQFDNNALYYQNTPTKNISTYCQGFLILNIEEKKVPEKFSVNAVGTLLSEK